jgi:excinuclease UvrABC nuclease subunit
MLELKDILESSIRIKRKPHISGIYFLIKNEEIIYIGQAHNVHSRIYTHRKNKRLNFDSYKIIEIKSFKGLLNLCALEKAYIEKYKPKFNKLHNPDYINNVKPLWFGFLTFYKSYVEVSKESGVDVNTVRNIINYKRIKQDNKYKKVSSVIMRRINSNPKSILIKNKLNN